MTKQETGSLAFKLAGVYAIIKAAPVIGYAVQLTASMLKYAGEDGGLSAAEAAVRIGTSALPCVLLLGLGAALIVSSRRLASLMFGDDEAAFRSISGRDAQAIAFSVVGLVLTMRALNPEYRAPIQGTLWTNLVRMVLQLGVGIALFFGARGLSNLWHGLRTAGHPQDSTLDGRQ